MLSLNESCLLLLILVANGSPVLLTLLMKSRYALPLDFGTKCFDGNPWLGSSKTWRGLLGATAATAVTGLVLGYNLWIGALTGLAAMTGDSFSSFIKRRFNRPPGSQVLLLDQIPECLLPVVAMKSKFDINWPSTIIIIVLFIILEILLSRLLYKLGLHKQPY